MRLKRCSQVQIDTKPLAENCTVHLLIWALWYSYSSTHTQTHTGAHCDYIYLDSTEASKGSSQYLTAAGMCFWQMEVLYKPLAFERKLTWIAWSFLNQSFVKSIVSTFYWYRVKLKTRLKAGNWSHKGQASPTVQFWRYLRHKEKSNFTQ